MNKLFTKGLIGIIIFISSLNINAYSQCYNTPNFSLNMGTAACVGETFVATNTSAYSATNTGITYKWMLNREDPATGYDLQVSSLTTTNYNDKLTYSLDQAGTYWLRLLTRKDCDNDGQIWGPTEIKWKDSYRITVSERPTANLVLTGSSQICTGESTNMEITFTGQPPWDIVYTDQGSNYAVNSITANPYILNVTPAVGNITYSLVSVLDNSACTGTVSGNVQVIVKNKPVASFTTDKTGTICKNETVSFVNTSTDYNYAEWFAFEHPKYGYPDYIDLSYNPTNYSYTFTETGNFRIKIRIIACSGYETDVAYMDYVVIEAPTTDAGLDQTICKGVTVQLGTAAEANVTYSWQPSAGLDNASAAQPNASPNNSKTYELTATHTNGCSSKDQMDLTVNPVPQNVNISANNNGRVCNDNPVLLDASGADTYVWSTSETGSQISVKPASNTTYTLTGYNTYNCSNTDQYEVKVTSTTPKADFALSKNNNICQGDKITINNNSTDASDYRYEIMQKGSKVHDNTKTDYTSEEYTFDKAGTFDIKITANDNCGNSDSKTQSVTVIPLPRPNFRRPSTGCTGQDITFRRLAKPINLNDLLEEDKSTLTQLNLKKLKKFKTHDNVTLINTYSWDFGDCTTLTSNNMLINHVYGAAGIYNVTLTVDNGICTRQVSKTITIYPQPKASFVFTSPVCDDNSCVSFDGEAQNIIRNLCRGRINIEDDLIDFEYTWDFGDGNTQTVIQGNQIQNCYSSPGNYFITLTVATLTRTKSIQYNARIGAFETVYTVWVSECSAELTKELVINPTPTVSITTTATALFLGESATLYATNATSYDWTLNASGTSPSISVSPTSTTTYKVVGTNDFNCTDEAEITIQVYQDITITPSNPDLCRGNFTDLTATGGTGSYIWSNGETTPSIHVDPNNTTTYTVEDASGSALINGASTTITVRPIPNVGIFSTSESICNGSPSSVTLKGYGAQSYDWGAHGGTQEITISPSVTTTYTLTGTNSYGCIDVVTYTVSVVSGSKAITNHSNWIVQKDQGNIGLYLAVDFYDGEVGITGGSHGIVQYTDNGGNTWYAVNKPNGMDAVYDIHISDYVNHGTWSQVLWQIHAIAVGENGMVSTTENSGQNWTTIFPGDNKNLFDMDFPSKDIGYSVGAYGKVLKTTDGGVSWSISYPAVANNRHLNGVHFINDQLGYAVGRYGKVLKTINSGTDWTLVDIGTTTHLNSVYSTDNSIFIVGDNGLLMRSTIGGMSWGIVNSYTNKDLNAVHFPSNDIGFIAGDNGKILRTTDGGATWSFNTSNVTVDLKDIYFPQTCTGYVCGNEENILKYYYPGPTAVATLSNSSVCFDHNVLVPTLGGRPSATGGSGCFEYNWIPQDFLDDPTSPNPVYLNLYESGNYREDYTLVVTDITTGCNAKDIVELIHCFTKSGGNSGPDSTDSNEIIDEENPEQELISELKVNRNNFKIYPNPVMNLLNIEYPSNVEFKVAIHDLNGKKITELEFQSSENSISIDTERLSTGVYILSIISEQEVVHRHKLVKF